MTIDNATATPETAHAAMMGPDTTAKGIAYSALAIAYSDMAKACKQLMDGTTDEALAIIDECATQVDFARRMLTGTIWTMPTATPGA
jgi:glutamate synthase domain-containing protein 1